MVQGNEQIQIRIFKLLRMDPLSTVKKEIFLLLKNLQNLQGEKNYKRSRNFFCEDL